MQLTFGPHITIQPFADRSSTDVDTEFLEGIASILATVARTHVGRTLIRHLRRQTFIYPLWDELILLPPDAIERSPAVVTNARAVRGQRVPDGDAGDDADMFFDPAWSNSTAAQVDGVMVHELTHALRRVHGASDTGSALMYVPGPEWSYPNREEWFAHTVMNMYLIELGRTGTIAYAWHNALRSPRTAVVPPTASFRRARVDDTAYDARLLSVARFEQTNIRWWVRSMSILGSFHAFAALDPARVPYNPFRDASVRYPRVLVPWGRPS